MSLSSVVVKMPIGKDIPRRQLWFQRDNGYFCEQWHNRYPMAVKRVLRVLDELEKYVQEKLEFLLGDTNVTIPTLNSMLINKYRDGSDSIRPHRDSAISFGEEPTIVVISWVSTRPSFSRKLIQIQDYKTLHPQILILIIPKSSSLR